MTNVESRELQGISQALVDRYSAEGLRKLLDPRSEPKFAFEYDRGTVPDGADVTTPLTCARHTADNWKRGWLAIRLVEEHGTPDGGKWREVSELPDTLRIAGEIA